MSDFEKFSLDLDNEAEYLSKTTGHTVDEANLYIDAELEYMGKIELICRTNKDSQKNLEEQQDDTNFVLDDDEMRDYISERTGLPSLLVDEFYENEYEYYKKIGLTNE